MRNTILISILLLAGCSHSVSMTQDILSQGRTFAAMDLQNAQSKAQLANDKIGMAIWTCLMPVTVTPNPNGVGVATGVEDARIVQSCLPINAGLVP